ncbi:hypothetical protein LCM10_04105 [Rossellomorea aquimaris]|uniref:hypothetical protein n=1 Tax=Rossellomorea aquimaris TaxID=189382 RepID=UPI001CD62314|nr:hypothetical protein [Rossellomorea aquimaris]MCA1054159.1 hypothetical protein [Rossellomorea aquimaris]
MSKRKGNSVFSPTGIFIKYTHVDSITKKVTATISYENTVLVTIVVDLNVNHIHIEGDFQEVVSVLPVRVENSYVEEIKGWAEFFSKREITEPQRYFEQFM